MRNIRISELFIMAKILKTPSSVAFIMDGNRRWAKLRQLSTSAGHLAGYQTLKNVAAWSKRAKIEVLYCYAFSTENWSRAKEEIAYLKELIKEALSDDYWEQAGWQIKVIGEPSRFGGEIQKAVKKAERKTRHFKRQLVIALSYGGRDEIVRAMNKISRKASARKITEKALSLSLDTKNLKDPEMLIRTGGEKRLSNFLLWQIAYSELFFTTTLWPDFSEKEFQDILKDFSFRQRNFGK